MTRRGVSILALLVVLGAVLELVFGVNDTGGIVAFVLLIWGCTAVPVGLALGRLIHDAREGPDDAH